MGILRKINRAVATEKRQSRAGRINAQLAEWYASHLVAEWQKKRVNEIRREFEKFRAEIDRRHDIACSRAVEDFMQFELDYLMASNDFKGDHPGEEFLVSSPVNVFKKAFYKNIAARAKRFGLNFNGGKTEAAK